MNKNEFIKRISLFRKERGLEITECYVSYRGSCLMLGIRKENDQIDLMVFNKAIVDQLIQDGYEIVDSLESDGEPSLLTVKYDHDIYVHLSQRSYDELKSVLVIEQGVQHINAEQTLDDIIDVVESLLDVN